ncbi:hypothetical protein CLOM_g12195 [Closterium sp. NIES-68]|nr:hypothetical protein CLOM_g12195 [Closterium sp. NIES-68]GJP72117.1 hypothetical protein CLOP_g2882 [Closterium sp. NIES-67]
MAAPMDVLVARLEAAVARLEASLPSQTSTATSAPATSASAAADHPSVQAFDAIVTANLQKVTAAAEKIGSAEVTAATKALAEAFEAEKKIVAAIATCKKPDASALPKLLEPLAAAMAAAGKLAEGKRTDAYNHVKAVAESVAALSWVAYSGKDCGLSLPAPHIDETWPAAEFYTNKILTANRNTEGGAPHVEWVKGLKELYTQALREYVKKFHLTGPSWSPSGLDLPSYLSSAPSSSAAPAPPRGPPPPPPPMAPPPPPPAAASGGGGGGGSDMSKVFSELNKGEAVTAGLRKVTADMKTKNRADRSGAVPASIGAGKTTSAAASAAAKPAATKPPKFELQQGRKWVVENQVDNKGMEITDTEPKQTVYIYGCKGSVVQVKGKVNNITLDKCTKTAVVFQDVLAACEMVNCSGVEVQCQGTAPTLIVDNTSGCQLYLAASALGAVITTAKSSEINVLVPGPDADTPWVEHALPEQFSSELKNGVFVTNPISHTGG